MKLFVALCALVAVVLAGEARDKRGIYSGGWNSGYSGIGGYGGYSYGPSISYSAPAAHVVAVNKVVNVPKVVSVPQVVHVRKVVSVPQVVTVKKVVSAPSYSVGIGSGYSGYGGGYSSGWW